MEFGAGDPRWFRSLVQEDQVNVLAFDRLRGSARKRTKTGGASGGMTREQLVEMARKDRERAAKRGIL